jgi:hypothetical protein
MGAVGPAEEFLLMLDPMANYSTSAVETGWSEGLNRAFKRVEGIGATSLNNVEGLIVSVFTYNAGSHSGRSSFEAWRRSHFDEELRLARGVLQGDEDNQGRKNLTLSVVLASMRAA